MKLLCQHLSVGIPDHPQHMLLAVYAQGEPAALVDAAYIKPNLLHSCVCMKALPVAEHLGNPECQNTTAPAYSLTYGPCLERKV